jgi:hypothetical protein
MILKKLGKIPKNSLLGGNAPEKSHLDCPAGLTTAAELGVHQGLGQDAGQHLPAGLAVGPHRNTSPDWLFLPGSKRVQRVSVTERSRGSPVSCSVCLTGSGMRLPYPAFALFPPLARPEKDAATRWPAPSVMHMRGCRASEEANRGQGTAHPV